jgi:protocatechuate 3,4-dioxygenase beta subunit
MAAPLFVPNRRLFLGALGASFFTTRGLFAEHLFGTPRMTEGPFYPDQLPLDQDNDLIIISDSLTPAVGEITNLTGRILDAKGQPLKNALVEIWQCDANQVYLHTSDSKPKAKQQDKNFQGYGKFETASTGEYKFRTIKPVPYPGRPAPHIHFKVSQNGHELITTQLMIRGHAGNLQDGVFAGITDLVDRELCQTDFKKVSDSKTGELAAKWDVVIGRTPDERDMGEHS